MKVGDKVRFQPGTRSVQGTLISTYASIEGGEISILHRETDSAHIRIDGYGTYEIALSDLILVPDIHVGDRVRVYCKRTEITSEGVVREITKKDDHKWLWIGKGYDIAADLNNPDGYEFEILERAFKWPDHEGFIRITGGKLKGSRALAYQNTDGGFSIRQDWGGYLTSDYTSEMDPEFDFEYVEG